MEVVVEFEYEALHEDELTLRPGDIIKNVRCIEEDGWMEGDLNGKHGLFPDNFVKEVKKEAKEAKHEPKEEPQQPVKRDKSSGTVANLVQRMSTIGLPTGGFQPRPSAAMKKPKKRLCRALYDYQPVNEDELELKVGDIVDVTEEVEEGWWSGVLNNKSGLFPSNFVKEVDPSKDNGDVNDTTAEDADGGVDSSQSAAGNGAIVQPKKVQRIGYGNIFKDGSLKSRIRIPNLETEEKKDTPSPSFPSAAKAAFPNMTEVQRGDGDSNTKAKDLCKATFAYESTNEDELSFHEDDIITVISKDTGEPGWWRGEIAGREGVFPDNFVLMLSDSEKEAHLVRGSRKSSLKHDSEEKPKKPPPPSKSIALKPEVPSADKKPHIRPEDKEEEVVSSWAMSPQLQQPAFPAGTKLPEFWQSDPASWFQHIEALFHLRGITGDDSRYYLVVTALDQATTRRAMQLLQRPPQSGKYAALKNLLLRRFTLTDAERADRLLSLPGLGDSTAVDLMDCMLSLLGSEDGGFIFPHLFLRQLPPAARAVLANSASLASGDYWGLAEEADRVLLASRRFAVQSLEAPLMQTMENADPAVLAGVATRKRREASQCFFHQRFGAKARRCIPPCSFTASGNSNAGVQ
ncbi:CD2-associated protein isoform X1 [Nerophis lumbriciformis]|uniref:CD2-associated protein isoform X1 n=1 Tax=Nerophis lumbriciformis TaxID=546530 RepID=UPI002AE06829|nr:CD2-associated protein-like isoform X1 [Nerophis lumbriciformis]